MASRRGLPSHLRRFGVIHVIIGLVAVVVIGGLLALDFSHRRAINVGTAQAWDIQGAPCPTATPQEWAATHQIAPKTFDYTGDVLGRVAGDASCSDVQDKGGKGLGVIKVCQFTSPAALTVKTKAGMFYFLPGVGQPATIIIRQGQPRCVLASKFTLKGGDKT